LIYILKFKIITNTDKQIVHQKKLNN